MYEDVSLSIRVAIVTGGGRGPGRAMALGLASTGCRGVITAARQSREVAAVAAEAGEDRVLGVTADVIREGEDAGWVPTARPGPPE